FAASNTYSRELVHSELQDAHHGCVNTQIVSPRLHRHCDCAHGWVRGLGPSEPLPDRGRSLAPGRSTPGPLRRVFRRSGTTNPSPLTAELPCNPSPLGATTTEPLPSMAKPAIVRCTRWRNCDALAEN